MSRIGWGRVLIGGGHEEYALHPDLPVAGMGGRLAIMSGMSWKLGCEPNLTLLNVVVICPHLTPIGGGGNVVK